MRVIVADDHPLFLDGLRAWLGALDVDVVGAARSPGELHALVARDAPDVVITDVAMPPAHHDEGLRVAEELAATRPDVGVLMLSAYLDPSWAVRLLHRKPTGVGYLLKHNLADADRLGEMLHRVATGGVAIDPDVAAELVLHRSPPRTLDRLSERERLVLVAMADGRSNRGIARALDISERTVENHVTSVFRKLDLPEGNQRVLAVLELYRSQPPRRGPGPPGPRR